MYCTARGGVVQAGFEPDVSVINFFPNLCGLRYGVFELTKIENDKNSRLETTAAAHVACSFACSATNWAASIRKCVVV